MNRLDLIDSIPVIVISSDTENKSIYRAYELGATDFLQHNADVFIFRKRISNKIQLSAQQKKKLNTAVNNTKTLEKSSTGVWLPRTIL